MTFTSSNKVKLIALACSAALLTPAFAAETASTADKAFVAKVSQGGMFEVELGKVAAEKGSTQAVKDNGVTEAHDHDLVGAKLKSISSSIGIEFGSKLNPEFQGKLDKISALTGKAFDAAYIEEMEKVHKIDGGLFAQEAIDGGAPSMKAFAAETHEIVVMHVGALKAEEKKK